METKLSELHAVLAKKFAADASKANTEQQLAKSYAQNAKRRRQAMRAFLWNPVEPMWYDYDMTSKKQNVEFFATNIAPIWAGVHDAGDVDGITTASATKALDVLEKVLLKHQGGVVSSNINTGKSKVVY